jgi:hypothetical protein
MHLMGGEATHRQHEQRAMGQAARTATGRRMRAALAGALVALAARLDPVSTSPRRRRAAPLATRA